MNNHDAPLHSLISGRLPRTISGEFDLFDSAEPEHLIEALSPICHLAPWEIKKCFDELARRNPRPHPQETARGDHPEHHTDPAHRTSST
jgi:hypothetical protein